MTGRTGPLAGIRIVEIDAIGPVPLAAMLLADMGADIVRVARPPSAGAGAWDDVGGDILHRSRAVTFLNLKDEGDRAALMDLIETADALIEGYRPGVMERLGLGPEDCLARNPALVFGRMTGWGQSGPLALRAGHDINYLSITGALHAMGDGSNPPPVPLNLVGDYGGGAMFLIAGLLAAILSAKATGKGQVVDACITDGVPSLMSLFYAWEPKGLWTDAPASNLLDGGAPFYRCYRCADGRDVAVGCLEPQFFAQMIKGLGLEDRGYRQDDRADWPRMEADFKAMFATRPRDEWAALFAQTDACVTPVLSMAEAPTHPHNVARASFAGYDGISQPAPAPRFSATPGNVIPPQTLAIETALSRWS
ncbi:CaiB/BaiF CoA-transferase family protein [Novosphingobium sp. CECT 9465]|uniref:CaiB/BaiF CoA transferase family protein n=1 Tax=Novosphingobium sp. CECT 9465 TaxID=2829794 RepID=UPI001F957336|nr:CaiB/BaiF CoA-transferase family protein [Novosphingobium sp. CECT 9465]CAH0495418.1 Acetyl-CoA:oxalate CoA-transferase [Novosphingobium sp. CECT 9465]